jgi:hypothetical protein
LRGIIIDGEISYCKIWLGAKDKDGYAHIRIRGLDLYPHVVAWQLEHQMAVPRGKELHHLCGNVACINPDHLVAVTRKEHIAIEKVRKK